MSHSHHDHDHGAHSSSSGRLKIAFMLAASYLGVEVVGGIYTGSLALLADAGHMLSDVASLGLAIGAMWLAKRPATSQRTFGNHRAEVLAALANGAALLAIGVFIIIEAAKRWSHPPDVIAAPMVAVAFGGLVMNIIALVVLSGGQKDSLNVRGAFLHVAADALGSVGAMISGSLIWAFGWRWADPLASGLIAILVIGSALVLVAQTTRVLMQSTPTNLDLDVVCKTILALEHVTGVHDLHAWTLTSGRDILTAHVVIEKECDWSITLTSLRNVIREEFSIDHTTFQPETSTSAPSTEATACGCLLERVPAA